MDETRQIIRFEVDREWSAEDLGHLILSVSDLYDLRLFLELLRDEWRIMERHYFDVLERFPRPFRRRRFLPLSPIPLPYYGWLPPIFDETQIGRLSTILEADERLQVKRLSYASPGSIDLAGFGAIVGHIKDFALKLIERRDAKRHRELSEEREALENDRLRIENARSFVALARDLGYSDLEVRQLVARVDERQETLFRLVESDKVRNVSIVDASSEGPDET